MSNTPQDPPPDSSSYQPPPPPPDGPGPGAPQGGQPGYGTPPTGQPGYGYGPQSGVGQPADLLMRFLARLIDFVLLGIVNAIITALLVVGLLGLNGGGYGFSVGSSYAAGAVSSIITAALSLGYFTLMESRNGQTLGKMLLKLQTRGPGGARPTTEEALRRNAWVALGVLGIIPIVGGVIGGLASLAIVIVIAVTISNSPTKQGWHDGFGGGTQVVKIG